MNTIAYFFFFFFEKNTIAYSLILLDPFLYLYCIFCFGLCYWGDLACMYIHAVKKLKGNDFIKVIERFKSIIINTNK
jgi:hypothetical protein